MHPNTPLAEIAAFTSGEVVRMTADKQHNLSPLLRSATAPDLSCSTPFEGYELVKISKERHARWPTWRRHQHVVPGGFAYP